MNLLKLKDKSNSRSEFIGMDHYNICRDKNHFKNYKKKISYEYNFQGFRDNEWPLDLKNKVWCLGDSYTVGIGQPFEETWPVLLEKKIGERCINIGEDGCSNDLMAARAKYIIDTYHPKKIIIMWSYFWRRYVNGVNIHYEPYKRETSKNDIENFMKNFLIANNCSTPVINLILPNCFITDLSTEFNVNLKKKQNVKRILKKLNSHPAITDIIEIEQIDYARDGHHFDILTCEKIVDDILTKY